ncbi:MAG: putative Ig domain-containing protein [Chloroflexota bacterium]
MRNYDLTLRGIVIAVLCAGGLFFQTETPTAGATLSMLREASNEPDLFQDSEPPPPTIPADHAGSDAYWAELAPSEQTFDKTAAFLQAQDLPDYIGGSWSSVIDWPFVPVSLANLPDGRLLSWAANEADDFEGPWSENTISSVWDPQTGEFETTNHPSHNMFCAHQVMDPQGNVVINGGSYGPASDQTAAFDFTSDSWISFPRMDYGRWYPTSVALSDGDIFTAIGWGGGNTAELYTYGDDWRVMNGINFDEPILNYTKADYGEREWWPLLTLAPNGKIFHAGPTPQMHWIDTTGVGSITEVGDPFNGWYSKHGAFVMYDEGKLLNAGGWAVGSELASTNKAYTLDINGTEPNIAIAESMANARKYHNGVMLPTGEILVIGGNTTGFKFDDQGSILTPEVWNPSTGKWSTLNPMTEPRNYHSVAVLMEDGRVFSGGGGLCGDDCSANHLNGQVYTPAYFYNPDGSLADRPTLSNVPTTVDLGQTFEVSTSGDIDYFSLIKLSSTTHALSTDLRYLKIDSSDLGSGRYALTAHENPNVLTPGYWFLFAVDGSGVPSVAATFKVINIAVASDNLALNGTVSQSSTSADNTAADRAIDDREDGDLANGSVAQTNSEATPWWEIDLGQVADITVIRLWNRTDCCGDELKNFSVFVSDAPFSSAALGATQAQSRVSEYTVSESFPASKDVTVNRSGRYVRVQLSGSGTLALAEVEIFTPASGEKLELPTVSSDPKPTQTAISFDIDIEGADLQYKWSFGDGTPETSYSSSSAIEHTFTEAGRYTIQVTVRDGRTGQTAQTQFVQSIYNLPTLNSPDSSSALLIEKESAEVWVINPDNHSVVILDGESGSLIKTIDVGAKPRAIAQASNGTVWVTNSGSDSLTLIDPQRDEVTQTINLKAGSRPYGVVAAAASNDLYVTLEGSGELLHLDSSSTNELGRISVGANPRHLALTGDGATLYLSRFITPLLPGEATGSIQADGAGGELLKINAANLAISETIILAHADVPDSEKSARGIPNYLGSLAISPDGAFGFVPSKQDNVKRGVLRDGLGLMHDNSVRAISSYVDLGSDSENLNRRIDHDNSSMASAAAFGPYGNYLFVALETSREISVVDALGNNELGRFVVGRTPQALTVSADKMLLYVHNFMDRSVSAIDISTLINSGQLDVNTIWTTTTVTEEILSDEVLLGKQLFYDAVDSRLSFESYMSCASCHNDGGHDGRVWDFTGFGEGLRNTTSLEGHGGPEHGRLHWSGNFDEVHDFEGQIRTFSGGSGLMSNEDYAATIDPLGETKAGRSADLDALAAYVNSLTTNGSSPFRASSGELTANGQAGRALFIQHSCAACHTGSAFTDSATGALHDIGTLDADSGLRLGNTLIGLDTPTLRGLWLTAPYLHDGSASTLQEAVAAHADLTLSAANLDLLADYLLQIDDLETTAPVNRPPTIAAVADQSHDLGALIVLEISGSDLDGDRLSYTLTGLPDGLAYDEAAGSIKGVTEKAGSFEVTVKVSDIYGASAETSFTWTVTASTNKPPIIATIDNQVSLLEEAVELVIEVNDPEAAAVSLTASGLPPGLRLDSATKMISGAPTAAGTYAVEIQAEDGGGLFAVERFSWRVNDPDNPTQGLDHAVFMPIVFE